MYGYGNRSTGKWVKRQGEGLHVTYMYTLFHYFFNLYEKLLTLPLSLVTSSSHFDLRLLFSLSGVFG